MYKEELPDQCPPQDAIEDGIPEAYRVVYSDPPADEDFKSRACLGFQPLSGSDDCGNASCSLFVKLGPVRRLAQLPKPRAKGAIIAKLQIPAEAGRWTRNEKGHVHFWMYETFDPVTAFVGIVE